MIEVTIKLTLSVTTDDEDEAAAAAESAVTEALEDFVAQSRYSDVQVSLLELELEDL